MFYDKLNNRLIYLRSTATEEFWDQHWQNQKIDPPDLRVGVPVDGGVLAHPRVVLERLGGVELAVEQPENMRDPVGPTGRSVHAGHPDLEGFDVGGVGKVRRDHLGQGLVAHGAALELLASPVPALGNHSSRTEEAREHGALGLL